MANENYTLMAGGRLTARTRPACPAPGADGRPGAVRAPPEAVTRCRSRGRLACEVRGPQPAREDRAGRRGLAVPGQRASQPRPLLADLWS